MIKHKDSHLDHGLTDAQVAFIMSRFETRDSFFVESFELPEDLGTVSCGLYGPTVGDAPVEETDVRYASRGNRAWDSRLVDRPARPTRTVTVIAGPYNDQSCVLYTAFGGPCAPQETGDPDCKDVDASKKFWAQHALAQ